MARRKPVEAVTHWDAFGNKRCRLRKDGAWRYRASPTWPGCTAPSGLTRSRCERAIETITYGELDERAEPVAERAGAPRASSSQDRVAFLDKNGPEYFDVLHRRRDAERRRTSR